MNIAKYLEKIREQIKVCEHNMDIVFVKANNKMFVKTYCKKCPYVAHLGEAHSPLIP